MNEKSASKGVLVYDSQCNLCLATKTWFEKRDTAGNVRFVSAYDSGLGAEFPQLLGMDLLGEITWIDQSGQVARGADAIASALRHIPGWRWAASLLMLPVAKGLRRRVYRWVAQHRYQWFGRSCNSGTCKIRSELVVERSPRNWPTIFSLLVIALVSSPILENFRSQEKAKDDFPFSYYPMFSSKRQNLYEQASVIAIKANGDTVPVDYKIQGNGGLNQNRRQLGKLLSVKKTDALRLHLSQVADRLAASKNPLYRGCVSVAAIKGTYDLNAYFAKQNRKPIDKEIILEVKLPMSRQTFTELDALGHE